MKYSANSFWILPFLISDLFSLFLFWYGGLDIFLDWKNQSGVIWISFFVHEQWSVSHGKAWSIAHKEHKMTITQLYLCASAYGNLTRMNTRNRGLNCLLRENSAHSLTGFKAPGCCNTMSAQQAGESFQIEKLTKWILIALITAKIM